jgi:16S rRNA processing protein RimM
LADTDKILLGKLIKPIGLDGEIRLSIEEGIEHVEKPQVLFQLRDDRFFPWFVQEWKNSDEGEYLVQFEELNSPEKAREICGQSIWVDSSLVSFSPQDDGRDDLIGYQIRDQQGKVYGNISEILDNSGQWLAVLEYENREILIPLAEENILGVQDIERYLVVDIPEGLTDL